MNSEGIKILIKPTISFAGITKEVECNLEQLSLRHMSGINEDGLRSLSLHLKNLKTIDLSYCPNVDMNSREVKAILKYFAMNGAVVLSNLDT